MLSGERLHAFSAIVFLLLIAGVVVGNGAGVVVSGGDPFDKANAESLVTDITDNPEVNAISLIGSISVDGFIGIAAAACLYLLFRSRNRMLALLGFAFLLMANAALVAGDSARIVLTVLADDFKDGGAGSLAAGDSSILEMARATAVLSTIAGQIGFSLLGLGFLSYGALLLQSPETGLVPPRWLGWMGVLAGAAGVLSWLVGVVGAFFVLFVISGIAQVIFIFVLALWLLRTPEEPAVQPLPA